MKYAKHVFDVHLLYAIFLCTYSMCLFYYALLTVLDNNALVVGINPLPLKIIYAFAVTVAIIYSDILNS